MVIDESRVDVSATVADLFEIAGDAASCTARLLRPYLAATAGGVTGPVILCGSGAWGRFTARRLAEVGRPASAFVDNAIGAQGSEVETLEVLSPAGALQRFGDGALYVVTIYNGEAMARQLVALGCRRVLSAASFYRALPEVFIPYYHLDDPRHTIAGREAIVALADRFDDGASRRIFAARVAARLGLEMDAGDTIGAARDCYLDPELFALGGNDVVVDCGAFDGDTVIRFLDGSMDPPRSVIALEPDPHNVSRLRATVASLRADLAKRVTVVEAATSRDTGRIAFDAAGTVAARIGGGTTTVACAALDDLQGEVPTFVKMDIEGHELEALHGLAHTMRAHAPILAISLYHRADDLWRIPTFIVQTQPAYRLHLRCYAEGGWETVCYAVPPPRSRCPA